MTKSKKITEDTECWFCHRKAKDVLSIGIKLGYNLLRECEEKERLQYAMGFYKFLDLDEIPICCICWLAMTQLSIDYFLEALHVEKEDDVITREDLKDLRFKILAEES